MREQIDRALDLWDFELARVLLASSEYKKEFDKEKLKEFESFFDRFTSHYECVSKKAKRYVANESATEAKAKPRKIFSKIWKFIRG
ncbi:hypothetical protein [Campylobacter helveticus]|uniref:hypothetical protein n=1 Tax=Campylobacter helveticus TaxID=28898 RepID=UPI0014864922|nr:hypothetical protein [Campylobacter helveticus]MCR2040186.1 hypothetical protein [Campylobacter helveticus]